MMTSSFVPILSQVSNIDIILINVGLNIINVLQQNQCAFNSVRTPHFIYNMKSTIKILKICWFQEAKILKR